MKTAIFAAAFIYYLLGLGGYLAMANHYEWTKLFGLLLWNCTFGITVGLTTLVCLSWDAWKE